MSHIEDYEKADCKLFRTPAIDASRLDKEIERIIMNAWKNGESVDKAIARVTGNDNLVKTLSGQIEESIEYKRSQAQKRVDTYAEKRKSAIEKRRYSQIHDVDETYGKARSEKEHQYEQAEDLKEQYEGTYNASETALRELQRKVYAELKELGGTEGLEQLSELEEKLNAAKAVRKKKVKPEEKEDTIQALEEMIIQKKEEFSPKTPWYKATGNVVANSFKYVVNKISFGKLYKK